ncbi:hypothetical protein CDIK_2367 [Cucumispora dikerogammari]|nr:hypothetical protein CDIK_2367 [Cucumispora dikerogammari]
MKDITKETPPQIFFENDNIKKSSPFPDTECSNNELSYDFEAPWFPDVIETKNEKHEGIVFIKNTRNLGNGVIILPNINKINYEMDQKNQNDAPYLELNNCDLTNRHITDHYIPGPSTLDKYYLRMTCNAPKQIKVIEFKIGDKVLILKDFDNNTETRKKI